MLCYQEMCPAVLGAASHLSLQNSVPRKETSVAVEISEQFVVQPAQTRNEALSLVEHEKVGTGLQCVHEAVHVLVGYVAHVLRQRRERRRARRCGLERKPEAPTNIARL